MSKRRKRKPRANLKPVIVTPEMPKMQDVQRVAFFKFTFNDAIPISNDIIEIFLNGFLSSEIFSQESIDEGLSPLYMFEHTSEKDDNTATALMFKAECPYTMSEHGVITIDKEDGSSEPLFFAECFVPNQLQLLATEKKFDKSQDKHLGLSLIHI